MPEQGGFTKDGGVDLLLSFSLGIGDKYIFPMDGSFNALLPLPEDVNATVNQGHGYIEGDLFPDEEPEGNDFFYSSTNKISVSLFDEYVFNISHDAAFFTNTFTVDVSGETWKQDIGKVAISFLYIDTDFSDPELDYRQILSAHFFTSADVFLGEKVIASTANAAPQPTTDQLVSVTYIPDKPITWGPVEWGLPDTLGANPVLRAEELPGEEPYVARIPIDPGKTVNKIVLATLFEDDVEQIGVKFAEFELDEPIEFPSGGDILITALEFSIEV